MNRTATPIAVRSIQSSGWSKLSCHSNTVGVDLDKIGNTLCSSQPTRDFCLHCLVPVALPSALHSNLSQKEGKEKTGVVHCQVQPAEKSRESSDHCSRGHNLHGQLDRAQNCMPLMIRRTTMLNAWYANHHCRVTLTTPQKYSSTLRADAKGIVRCYH